MIIYTKEINKYSDTDVDFELNQFMEEYEIKDNMIININCVITSHHMLFDDVKKEGYSPYLYTIYVREY